MEVQKFIEWIDDCDAVAIKYDNSKGRYLEFVTRLSPELQVGVDPLVVIESKEEGYTIVINNNDIKEFKLLNDNSIYMEATGITLTRYKQVI